MDLEPAPETLPPGTTLAHYRVGAVLGSGAMGVVYRAHDMGLDRGVAVKVLKPVIASDPRAVERFFREARAAARVTHDNLAHVYFVGSEGSQRFFAMEHVPGANLEDLVRDRGPLPLDEAVDVLVQAARGLAAAHAAGVVHRDVKPSNLLLRPDGRVKVTDFGLARSVQGEIDVSGAGAVTGTPTYMSPEQVRGEAVDVRSDVYALGLTAFYLLTGHPPFPGPTLGKVLADQLHALLPSLAPERPDLPPAVDGVLARMCAKDPELCPASMEQVLTLLEGMRPRAVERAPFAARGSALLIDGMLLALVWAALGFLLVNVLGWTWAGEVLERVASHVLWAASQLGMELWNQASVGKWLLRLTVVRDDGLRPSRRALLLRFLVRSPETLTLALVASGRLADRLDGWLVLAAVLAGCVCWLVARGRTLSDVLTHTTVAYRHLVRP